MQYTLLCLVGAKYLKTNVLSLFVESLACFTLFHSLSILEPLHISACHLVWFWVPVLRCLIVETSFHGIVILKSSFNLPGIVCLIFVVGVCQVFIKSSLGAPVGSKFVRLGWEVCSECSKIWHQAGFESRGD